MQMDTITNKRSFIHLANRKRSEEQDLMDKMKMNSFLRTHFNCHVLIDHVFLREQGTKNFQFREKEAVNFNNPELYQKYQVNVPDLIQKHPWRIFELDGLYHFLKQKGINQTKARNLNYGICDFTEKNHNLIVLNDIDLESEEDELVKIMSKKLNMEPVKESDKK